MSGISAEQPRNMLVGGARRVCENRAAADELNVFPAPDGVDRDEHVCSAGEEIRWPGVRISLWGPAELPFHNVSGIIKKVARIEYRVLIPIRN